MQVMRTVSTMQAGRHDNLMLSAASCPPLQKTQGRGTHSFETGKENLPLKGRGTRPQFRNGKEEPPVRKTGPPSSKILQVIVS